MKNPIAKNQIAFEEVLPQGDSSMISSEWNPSSDDFSAGASAISADAAITANPAAMVLALGTCAHPCTGSVCLVRIRVCERMGYEEFKTRVYICRYPPIDLHDILPRDWDLI